jgi:hypothetical protein
VHLSVHRGSFGGRGSGRQILSRTQVTTPEDVGCFFPRGADIFGIKVRGFRSIGKFLRTRRVLRAIRAFNLTHMNRGRNAYQASHCYSLADHMLARRGSTLSGPDTISSCDESREQR